MAIVDAIVAIFIVGGFAAFVTSRLAQKYPTFGELLAQYSPLGLMNKDENNETKDTERRQQVWSEARMSI